MLVYVGDNDYYVCVEGERMKKLHLYKIYTPQDIATFISREEKDIIELLETRRNNSITDISKFHFSPKTIGRKIMGYWYVRGKEIIEIQKLLKGVKK